MAESREADVSDQAAPCLADDVRFRRESFAVLAFKVPPQIRAFESLGLFYFLDPRVAIILSLLDIADSVEQVVQQAAFVFEWPLKAARVEVQHVLYHNEALLADIRERRGPRIVRHDPASFVIPKAQIDVHRRRLDAPLEINFLASMRCPCNCVYCYAQVDRNKSMQALPTSRVLELIDEAHQLGVAKIVFSGGEPLLRRNICDILERAVRRGIRVFISTKKRVRAAEANALAATGIEVMQVSIDSLDDEIGSFMAGSPHYPQQAMATLHALLAAGLKLRTNSVVTPFNLHSIPYLVGYLAELEGIIEIGLAPYGRSFYRHSNALFLSPDQYRWLKQHVENLRDRFPHVSFKLGGAPALEEATPEERRGRFAQRSICSPFRTGLTILPDGKVLFCEEMPIDQFVCGDLSKQSIQELWNSSLALDWVSPPKEKFRGTACYTCEEFARCHSERGVGVCLRDALKAYGRAWGPTPDCPRAPAGALRLG